MAREEKQANIYAIPKNSFDTGYVFGGQFKTRNFVEGVVVTLPFLGIFLYGWAKLGLDFESTVAYCFILCAAVFVSVVHGVGGDSLFEFIARVVKFRQNRRISKYNPRIKTELEPDYLLHDDTMLPKEKLKRALENIKSKVVGGSDEPISADITDEDLQVYYDDDEDFVEKPDELKSKAELKAEAKQRAKEEKEFIKSLPRNQRRMARAELKRKHKEEAEAAKKREEEREQMIQEAIKHRLEKAERVKAAQVRAHLTALERQRVLEQADDPFAARRSRQGLHGRRAGPHAGESSHGRIDVARDPALDVEVDAGPDRCGALSAPFGGVVAVVAEQCCACCWHVGRSRKAGVVANSIGGFGTGVNYQNC